MIRSSFLTLAAGAAALLAPSLAQAATVTVREFLPAPVPAVPAANAWYASDVRGAGTVSIPDLTGAGGDLEINQPLPIGAALLTTGFSNNDKAEIGTFGDLGDANTVLSNADLGYSYYKQTVAGGNVFAAPSLKLALFSAVGTGDNFGQLIYEPNWNQPGGGSQASPADAWQSIAIDSSTGASDDSSGGWWWTGGFNVASSAGGPPIRSLGEWAGIFSSADPDFAAARVVSVAVGVGTFNQGQVGYVDEVTYGVVGGASTTWDFEPIPEPAAMALLAMASVLVARRR